jgi:cell wall-associated NlpC family hydrolase
MSEIADAARKYIGVPFVHQGRSSEGLDCVGLLVQVAKDLGYEVQDFTAYSLRPRAVQLMELIGNSCDRVDGAPQPGDILVFAMIGPSWPQHAAIKTEPGMIHSFKGGPNKVVEVGFDDHWQSKLHSTWRYRWQH